MTAAAAIRWRDVRDCDHLLFSQLAQLVVLQKRISRVFCGDTFEQPLPTALSLATGSSLNSLLYACFFWYLSYPQVLIYPGTHDAESFVRIISTANSCPNRSQLIISYAQGRFLENLQKISFNSFRSRPTCTYVSQVKERVLLYILHQMIHESLQ